MKKNLLKSVVATLCLLFVAIAAQAQNRIDDAFPNEIYLIGSDGNWDISKASATLPQTTTKGVYKGKVNVSNQSFIIGTKLMKTDSDWEDFNTNYRYSGGTIKPNTEIAIIKGEDSFYIPYTGEYTFTVDMRNMTLKAESETVVTKYPYNVYFFGTDGEMKANSATKVTWEEVDGVYVGWVEFKANTFKIATKMGDTADDWDAIAENAIGTETEACNIETDLTVNLKTGTWTTFNINASKEAPVKAQVSLDLRKNRITLFSCDENYPTKYPKEMYVMGSNQEWYPTIPSDIIPAAAEAGKYVGKITFTNETADNGYGYFSLYKRFGKDWEYINQKRLYALNDGEKVNVGSEVPTFVNYGLDLCSWNFTGAPGTYYISIDLTRDDGFTNGYFTISENEPTAINIPLAKPTGKTYYYDLNGHFLGTQEPQKGVFVVKGKKVVK